MRASIVVLVLVACSRPGIRATPPRETTCATAAANYAAIMEGGVRDTARPAARQAYEHITLTRCQEDRWPAPAIACVSTSEDPVACLDQLPEAHASALDEQMAVWRGANIDAW